MKDRKTLKPAERLIVAADFKPSAEFGYDRQWIEDKVKGLAIALQDTGVYLKVNSALRATSYELIDFIHANGLKVFADLKLFDIPETLAIDGMFLRQVHPEMLTVVCHAGMPSMKALKLELPETEIVGVTMLTSLRMEDLPTLGYFNQTNLDVVVRALTQTGMKAGLDGNVCSGAEAALVRRVMVEQGKLNATINTPGIRTLDSVVKGDDQNPERIMTPTKAIMSGVDRIVVGRPIVRAEKPYDVTMRIIEEIAKARTVMESQGS